MDPSYRIVEVTADNIDDVGLYCSRSKHKEKGYQNKLEWIKERFKEGLEYHVLLVDEGRKNMAYRGMIEYMPADKCWRGIDAPGYMAIHCIWVVGRHKNKGYGSILLQRCIDSAGKKGKNGVVGITIEKGGWLPKKQLYEKKGFKKIDEMPPDFSLYALKFKENAPDPRFHPAKPELLESYGEGFSILTSCQCPYMAGTVESLKIIAEETGENVRVIEMADYKQAQMCGLNPYGTFHVIRNSEYVTHLPGGMRDIKRALEKIK